MNTRAKELDRKFDVGEDITRYLDLSKARRPGHEERRVNGRFSLRLTAPRPIGLPYGT